MIKYHSLVFYVKVPFEAFGFTLFLDVFFSSRIKLYNLVFLVSCVDLLKTNFTISLSELQVEMNIFLFQLEFSSTEHLPNLLTEPTLLLSVKESNNSASIP